jgi:hypothetical protein
LRAAIFVLAVVLATSGVLAQRGRGGITGVVTNSDGPVAGATIQAKQQATGRVFTATSMKSGQFSVGDLPDGTYDIAVPSLGLSSLPFSKQGVTIESGKTTRLDITLMKGNLGVIGDDNAYIALHNKYANVRGPAPRTPVGRPDLSGVWNGNLDANPPPVSLLPWAADAMKQRAVTHDRDQPSAHCLPDDPTPTIPLLRRFVQTPTMLVLLFEQEPHYRQIFLDGRPHPADLDPTWMGHSIGKWEKDALVVDTVGFNDKSWILFPAFYPHTEMLHMVERYRRPDLGHLTVDLSVEDPGTFTKPIEWHMAWELAPGEEILESLCTENNKFQENAGIK